jgi:hypothetical protein
LIKCLNNASDNLLSKSFSLTFTEEFHAEKKEVIGTKEIVGTQIQQGSEQDGCERDAQTEARDAEVRPRRQRRKSEEPQTGDRDRAFGGTQEGRQGSEKKSRLRDLTQAPRFLPSRVDPFFSFPRVNTGFAAFR